MGDLLPWLMMAVCLAVFVIHSILWRLLVEQKRHNRSAESLLAEIRDRLRAGG
jgi:hypothetical protein